MTEQEIVIHYDNSNCPPSEFEPKERELVVKDPNRKIFDRKLKSPMHGIYYKFPPHRHNNYEEEFIGGFKHLHKDRFFYHLGIGGFDAPIQMVTGKFTDVMTEERKRKMKIIENTLKKYPQSDLHFELYEDESILVCFWNQKEYSFLMWKHTPTCN
jgi:hypothetical protein